MRKVLLAVAMVVGFVFVPRVAVGQSCGPYETCFSGGDHKVPCPLGSGVQNCHTDCATCIYGDCHPDCGGLSLTDPQESKRYALLLKLADALDIEGIVAEARNSRSRVFYNPEREAVQIIGCDGTSIIANLPVRSVREKLLAGTELPVATDVSGLTSPPWHVAVRQVATRPAAPR